MAISFEEACAELLPPLQRSFSIWRSDATILSDANLREIPVPADIPDTVAAWFVPFQKSWRRGQLSLVLVKGMLHDEEHVGLAWHLAFCSTNESDPVVDYVFLEDLTNISLSNALTSDQINDFVNSMLACEPAQLLKWVLVRMDTLGVAHQVVRA